MASYALIHVLEPARAAQYAALVERQHLSATPARSIEEALFHAQRLGPAALIIDEVLGQDEGFGFLRSLRKAKQVAPALVVSGSWKLRNEANRLRKSLHIFDVLAPSQSVATVEKAVERAARGETREIRKSKKGSTAVRAEEKAERTQQLDPDAPARPGPPSFPPMPMARALRTPLHAPYESHALERPSPEAPSESLEESLARTGRSLRAAMALLWLDDDHGGGLHGYFGWDAGLVPMVGTPEEWAPFRRMASTAPVLIQEAAKDKVLSRSPLVSRGLVGCFAGAPVPDARGERAGVLWIVQEKANGLVPDVLEPLTVWAQHLGAELVRLPLPAADSSESAAPAQAAPKHARKGHVLDQQTAFEAASLAVDYGILITDSGGRIAASNRAALKILGLKNRRLTGLVRGRLLERLRLEGKLDVSQKARLTRASAALDLELKVGPAPQRVLHWELRHLRVGRERCVVDRIRDVTDVRARQLEEHRLQRVDALTWLGNRKAFDESLAAEISRALRMNTALSLALFTIDGRDQLDAPLADRVLRDVAWVLADLKRGYDPAARLDAGMLAVILPGASAKAALVFAGRVAEDARDLEISDLPRITLSGGVAEFDRAEDVDALLARARAAVLEAAACGGNGVL